MRCPFCKSLDSRVVDSRLIEEGLSIRRRRECSTCQSRFTTYERCTGVSLMVVKKNGRREPFDRKKIRNGIVRACSKRGIPSEMIDRMVDEIERAAFESPNSEIKADTLGQLVMDQLKKIDEVAYLRFASVYKKFEDRSQFISEAKNLENPE